jgi:hypothetical protein
LQVQIVNGLDDWTAITGLWFVMAANRQGLETIALDPGFPARQRAALLCSKLRYCCEDYCRALEFALEAGEAFNLEPASVRLPAKAGIDGMLPQDEFVRRLT